MFNINQVYFSKNASFRSYIVCFTIFATLILQNYSVYAVGNSCQDRYNWLIRNAVEVIEDIQCTPEDKSPYTDMLNCALVVLGEAGRMAGLANGHISIGHFPGEVERIDAKLAELSTAIDQLENEADRRAIGTAASFFNITWDQVKRDCR